jgi:hypothetical protein
MQPQVRDVAELAMDRRTMLLIGSAVVAVLVIASILVGPGGLLIPR